MRIEVSRDVLADAVTFVSRAAGDKSTQPVQSCICLEAAESRLRLAASDLEYLHAERSVEATGDTGTVLVQAKLLQEVVRQLRGDTVVIETVDDGAAVSSNGSRYVLRMMPPNTWEMLPPPEGNIEVNINGPDLTAAIDHVVYATLKDETRPILTGVLFTFGDDLTLVATDTYRLAQYRLDISGPEAELIIPYVFLKEAARLLKNYETARFSADGHVAEFAAEDMVLRTRLIAGRFPNYERVIPTEYVGSVYIGAADLLAAINRVGLVAREDANRIVFALEDDELVLTAEAPDIGRAEARVACKTQGEVPEIAFNGRYLAEALNVISEDEVELSFSGKYSPARLTKVGGDAFLYILMPMQILPRGSQ